MPLFDFECTKCKTITEGITSPDVGSIKCSACGEAAKKIFSPGKVYTANEDTGWLKTVLEVVEKGSGKPHCEEFLKNPTRGNYKKWMKGEGLRPLERSEPTGPVPWRPDQKFTNQLHKKHQERNAVRVG